MKNRFVAVKKHLHVNHVVLKNQQKQKNNKMDKFKEHACEFKNESDCEEELEEEGLEYADVEENRFEE